MNTIEIPLLVPLGTEAHRTAREFAIEQSTPQKGKQVYLNTLAAIAVHNYLKWLEIETDFRFDANWESTLAGLLNSRELLIPDIGKLECYPVLPEGKYLRPNPTIDTDLIGCVAVRFDENLNKGELFGFVPTAKISTIPKKIRIDSLQPLDSLLDCIHDILDNVTAANFNIAPVNLSNWLENIFTDGWLKLEDLLSTPKENLAFSTRSNFSDNLENSEEGITRGKKIDLGIQLGNKQFALIVTLLPTTEDEEVYICLRVYPTGNQIYLPKNLQLTVLDETGTSCVEISTRDEDNWIQSEFSGQTGEEFSVKLVLGDISITEDFVI